MREGKAEALRWYLRGATGGHCESMRMVANILSDPKLGAVEVAEAVRWYRIAAQDSYGCGNGANYALAIIFSKGQGNVARDYSEALQWFKIAGFPSVAAARAEMARLKIPEPE